MGPRYGRDLQWGVDGTVLCVSGQSIAVQRERDVRRHRYAKDKETKVMGKDLPLKKKNGLH